MNEFARDLIKVWARRSKFSPEIKYTTCVLITLTYKSLADYTKMGNFY